VISGAEARRVDPGPGATAQLLSRLNGVSVFDDQGTRAQPTLDLRGWTLSPVVGVAQGVSVFLDGVRVNEADAQEVNFDLIPEDAIASASVVRGPEALYGKNTLAGAVLLTTRRGFDAPGIDAAVSAGRFGFLEGRLVAGATTSSPVGPLDALLLVRGSNETGYRAATDANTRMLFVNLGRRSSESDADVALSVLYAHDKLYQAGSLPESWLATDPQGNYTPGDFFAPDLLHVNLRGSLPLGLTTMRGNAFVRTTRSQQFNVNIAAPSSRANVDATTLGSTVEWDVPFRFRAGVGAFTVGGELSHDLVKYRVLAEPTRDAPDLPDDCDASGLCENARVNSDNGGVFGQLVLPLITRAGQEDASSAPLSLTLAARGDWVRIPLRDLRDPANDGTTTYRRGSPRVALAYRAPADASAYVAVSTGYRAPAPLELACGDETAPCLLPFSLGDDPPLAPVTVLNYETGATWSPLPWLAADLSLYLSRIRNEIVFAASTRTAGYFRNVPRTSRNGVEVSVRAERRRAGMTWRAFGQYAYVDARYRSSVQLASALPDEPVTSSGDRMALSPAHRATLGIGATALRRRALIDAELRVRGVSSQFLRGDEANTQPPLPGYATVSAHLSARISKVQLSVDGNNLLDRRFVTFGTYAPDVLAAPAGGTGEPPIARFLTPGYPRSLTLTLSTIW
jgi:outer membrane receptor protein involved in Fe transport